MMQQEQTDLQNGNGTPSTPNGKTDGHTLLSIDHALVSDEADETILADLASKGSTANKTNTNAPPQRKRAILISVYLGVCFFFVFFAFGVSQSLITTLHPTIGFVSLALIYGGFAVGAVLAPLVITRSGPRIVMLVSSLLYALFVFTILSTSAGPLLFMCILVGLAAGGLWVGEGVYLSRVVDLGGGEEPGLMNGVFFTVFASAFFVGNVISGLLLGTPGFSTNKLLVMLGFIGLFGTMLFTFVPKLLPSKPEPLIPVNHQVWDVMVALDGRIGLALPFMLAQGVSIAFTFASYPSLMTAKQIPYAFAVYGVAKTAAAVGWGKVLDRFGWRVYISSNIVIATLAMITTLAAKKSDGSSDGEGRDGLGLIFTCGFFWGLFDSSYDVFLNATTASMFRTNPKRIGNVLAAYRAVCSIFAMIMFIVAEAVPLPIMTVMNACGCIVALLLVGLLRFRLDHTPEPEEGTRKPNKNGKHQQLTTISTVTNDHNPEVSSLSISTATASQRSTANGVYGEEVTDSAQYDDEQFNA